jgi:outer membrane protein TolC
MILRSAVAALVPLALAGAVLAPEAGAEPVRLGLRATVDRALAESHVLKAGDADVAKAGENVRKAQAQRILPKAEVNLRTGLVPAAHGDILFSPQTRDTLDNLGPYYRLELSLAQPLWTFGKLDALEAVARQGLATEEARRTLTRENVSFDAAKAYATLVAAARSEAVARDMRHDFDQLQGEVEKRLKDESSGVDDADLFEVRTRAFGIDRAHFGALEVRRLATDALRAMLALADADEPEPVGEPSPLIGIDEAAFPGAVARAVEQHPEVRALAAAGRAVAANVDLQRKSRNPVVFLGAEAGVARAGNRDEQDNPWVQDDFNFTHAGAAVVMTWDANLHRANIDVSAALDEQRALAERLEALRSKVGVDVRQALRAVLRERALLDSARSALRAAKSRLRLVLDTWETGLGDVSKVLDSYEKYYELRAEEPQRELALNLAVARLSFVLGDVNLYLGWVERGKVSL